MYRPNKPGSWASPRYAGQLKKFETVMEVAPVAIRVITASGGSIHAPRKVAGAASGNSSTTGLVLPGLNTSRGATNADAVWKQAGADEGPRQGARRTLRNLPILNINVPARTGRWLGPRWPCEMRDPVFE